MRKECGYLTLCVLLVHAILYIQQTSTVSLAVAQFSCSTPCVVCIGSVEETIITSICICAAPQPVTVLLFGAGGCQLWVAYAKPKHRTSTATNRYLAQGDFGTCSVLSDQSCRSRSFPTARRKEFLGPNILTSQAWQRALLHAFAPAVCQHYIYIYIYIYIYM